MSEKSKSKGNLRCALSLVALLFCAVAGAPDSVAATTGLVHIKLSDSYGVPLDGEPRVETFRLATDGPNLAAEFKDGSAKMIPYGVYSLRARASGFWSATREVRVFEPEVWVAIGLEIGMGKNEGGFPTSKVLGTIVNPQFAKSRLHLRLSAIYSNTILDSQTASDGGFRFENVPNGLHVLTVTDGTEILDVRKLKVTSDSVSLKIDFPRSTDTAK